ncbi:suppressor of glycerol defect [Yamadazyma tenuis]|nr:suppressor of glycerol defect [Yamadazyma tenuis]
MAKGNRDDARHGIRMPGALLDSIRDKTDKGDYEEDSRFRQSDNKKKRKSVESAKSRKEKRQEDRKLKKQKRSKNKIHSNQQGQAKSITPSISKQVSGKSHQKSIRTSSEDPIEELRMLKEKKGTKTSGIRIVREEDLSDDSLSDDFGSYSEGSEGEDEEIEDDPMEALRRLKEGKPRGQSELRIVKEDELEDDEFDESDFSDDILEEDEFENEESLEEENDPIAKLKALKEAKIANQPKEKSKDKIKTKSQESKRKPKHAIPESVREQMKKDEEEMAFYAKKLGLKNGKKSKLNRMDDDDVIGGLLDGLDLDFASEAEVDSELEEEEGDEDDKEDKAVPSKKSENLPFGSDDSLSEGDFDSDLESELEELYGTKRRGHEDDDDDDDEANTIPSNENPFVAPSQDNESSSKYIPPALRRKMALEAEEVSPEILALQRTIKGAVNKLSEGNMNSIVNEINAVYLSNPRNIVNETLTNTIIDGIVSQGRLLETFVYLQSCLVTAVYRLQGVEFGAHFIQTLIERFDKNYQNSSMTKEVSNIISLLSSVYSFQLVSSKLIYDIIKVLINEFNESNAEILLRLIRNCGNNIRTDDPTALKEIVILTNKVFSSMKDANPRTQFLVETINSLKNNKLKAENDFTQDLGVRLKKFLGTLGNLNDPIQVSLDDIRNVETKGKWWLIGSAWKGNDATATEGFDSKALSEVLDGAETNWMRIAKEQRMNTDIRRAIFITIMSAEDYVDALTRLDKLQLKKAQEREIPRILIHSVCMEQSWNPYYGLLASKLSESHSYRKTFQFMFWDVLKEFEKANNEDESEDEFIGFDDESEESKLKRIYNLGRFFGFLIAEGSLPLHSLKNVNFLVATNDTKLLLEIVLVTFLDQVGKKSQINVVGTGIGSKVKTADLKFSDQLLIERIMKAKEQTALLRGLQYFVQEKTLKSNFVDGKRQKKRVEWGSNAMFDIIDELLLNAQD